MAGYWPHSFCGFIDLDSILGHKYAGHKHAKKNYSANIQPS